MTAELTEEEIPEAGRTTALLLAALRVDADALVVLGLAGISAGVRHLVAGVAVALAAVALGVQLEGLLAPVVLEIVASHDGEFDAANWVARSVTNAPVGGLLADVGDRWDGALGRVGSRGYGRGLLGAGGGIGARESDLGCRGRVANRGMLGIAVTLAQA